MATVTIPQQIPTTQQPSENGFAKHEAPAPDPQTIVLQAGLGYIVSACLSVSARLNLADLIGSGATEVSSLARLAQVNEDYLYRVLRVLEMAQIVDRTGPRAFGLTPAGELLRREVPGSLAAAAEWLADPLHFSVYGNLLQSVKTGMTTFDHQHGEPFFNWLSKQENAEEAQVFNNAMTSFSEMCIPAFLEIYNFGQFTRIVDVGGGHGAILRAILKEYRELSGTIAEMPFVVPNAKTAIAGDGLAHRCNAVECDFFAAVPAGGDAYFMKNIVHDWADDKALQLLRNIRAVIPQHGKLLLAEAVLNDSPGPHPGKVLDIEMMAFVGGRERTEEEFRQLLAKAGFQLERVIPTRSPLSLLEAAAC
jgi:hypothetical protein